MKISVSIKSPKKFKIEDLLKFLAKRLDISDSVELSIFYNNKLLDKLSKSEIKYDAILQQPVPHKYVLYVREDVCELNYIICHELIHLSQMEKGDLIINSNKEIIWKGNKYNGDIPYNNREWEKEAFKIDTKLWKEYKKWKSK